MASYKCPTCGMETTNSYCPQCLQISTCPTCHGSGKIKRLRRLV